MRRRRDILLLDRYLLRRTSWGRHVLCKGSRAVAMCVPLFQGCGMDSRELRL